MIIDDRYISAPDLSAAWLDKARLLCDTPGGKTVHLLVRIADPSVERPDVRAAVQGLIDVYNAKPKAKKMPAVETTRNTIFPASYAARTDGPEELGAYYIERYTKEGILGFSQNQHGTYFGRIVAYPRKQKLGGETSDQLKRTIEKLKEEIKKGSNKSSRYEINVFNERWDTTPMGFPCLAHLSVHLHDGKVHLQAIYRNESLVARTYGNWLGLAELQAYIAEQAEAGLGELLITAGHVERGEGVIRAVQEVLDRFDWTRETAYAGHDLGAGP